ncbi:hypothetical protein R3W88_028801 [Solanum pinnatisectum]|uniref:SKP1-like protein n=1 Tax=Solanum pinnatisectum TaxID=50273 RepID=A0AAV9K3G8_9SOLN|nr:hypothetical protein R3W88_028801 [Solanum pinnatisectum]
MASSSSAPESKILTLKSAGNDEFQVEASIAVQSIAIKNMVEDGYTNIPLVSISSEKSGCSEEELKEFDNEFVKMSIKKMSLFVFAANFLHIAGLTSLLCQTIADKIKNKSVNAVRRIFDIISDYTTEEKAEIRAEHDWAHEGELDETVDDDDVVASPTVRDENEGESDDNDTSEEETGEK